MATTLTLVVDDDDERAIRQAVAVRQRKLHESLGAVVVDRGESDQLGAQIGEICRDWMAAYGDSKSLPEDILRAMLRVEDDDPRR